MRAISSSAHRPGPGGDLSVPAGPGLPNGLIVPAAELAEQFSRASGPGGQKVNTSDTKAELRFDVTASAVLTDEQRQRLLDRLAGTLVGPEIIIVAREHRSQHQNRVAARRRLATLLRASLAPPPPKRRATKPTRGAQRRRLKAKSIRSRTKSARGRVTDVD